MSARSSTEKQPKIKGIVKRCRSFKEDIISRLARNRSIGNNEGVNLPRNVVSPSGGWNSGGVGSPTPNDNEIITDPFVLVTHRLKEANLTLQFVESLIQKNCVDLLGGSSNVMLDLVGCLLNDIKKTSASDSAAYQSAISQIKSALSDFLTAVDVLLLKERCDEAQKELYFEKVLDTLKSTRDALSRLKNLIDSKENGHHHGHSNSVRHHSSSHLPYHHSTNHTQNNGSNGGGSSFLTSTPTKLLHSPSSKSSPFGGESGNGLNNVNSSSSRFSPVPLDPPPPTPLNEQEKKPPLPPKLKQWSTKSFDMEWPQSQSTSPGPYSPHQSQSREDSYSNLSSHSRSQLPPNQNNNLSPHHQSLLTQWLEQASVSNQTTNQQNQNPHHHHHHHHHRSQSQHNYHHHQRSNSRPQINSASSVSKFEGETTGNNPWTESAIYVSRSIHSTSSTASHSNSASSKLVVSSCGTSLLNLDRTNLKSKPPGGRTYSDSYQLDSQESLNQLDYDCSRSGRSTGTHNSQSLSLGSSLDNLLLVDSHHSTQSGLSPNSNASGGGGSRGGSCDGGGGQGSNNPNRISVSSNISNHTGASISGIGTHGLASLSNYDPDLDVNDPDGDNVFTSPEPPHPPRLIKTENDLNSSLNDSYNSEVENSSSGAPPTLPEKQNRRHFLLGQTNGGIIDPNHFPSNGNGNGNGNNERCPSPYENVDANDLATWHGSESRDGFNLINQQKQFMSYSESRNTLVGAATGYDSDERPPLPPKKKHSLIAAYVEFLHNFESFSQQHHTHFHNHLNHNYHPHHQSQHLPESSVGPVASIEAQRRQQFRSERSATLHNPGGLGISSLAGSGPGNSIGGGITRTPTYSTSYHQFSFSSSLFSPTQETSPTHQILIPSPGSPLSPTSGDSGGSYENSIGSGGSPLALAPALPPKKTPRPFLQTCIPSTNDNGVGVGSGGGNKALSSPGGSIGVSSPGQLSAESPVFEEHVSPSRVIPTVITPVHPTANNSLESPQMSLDDQTIDLFILEALPNLVPNESLHSTSSTSSSTPSARSNSDGPEIKGGEPHLLIVYAASPELKDLRFREVFLLTYRTFVRPVDVVNLLWKRYQHFEKKNDRPSIVHARATLDLFVEVVNSLTPMDLEDEMVAKLRNCIYHLVTCGEIQNALKARKGLIIKYQIRQKLLSPKPPPASLAVTSEAQTLLQYSATSIAQNMTLLDAELFRQLEPAELLLWAREQSEDFCPALNNFTEHFNKVSYWARSKVLLCSNSRERNRTMKKLIEVMRKLREFNNFNSLLAVLAALDSAPIRRLGFSRRLTEALKPHAALTDSSGSFRTYRQALAESKPPCIPYIGLVLQDLTFVHIGNADFLADGKVNWVKRWQQWVVLEPVRRFYACHYVFVRNDPLLNFLNNFDESLNDDELWQLSESIKPRGKS